VDAQARVYVGGLALGPTATSDDEGDFLQRMYAHRPDLAGNVDGIGLHPYQATVRDTDMRIARFRQDVNRVAGPTMPIEITEVGWSTTAVPEAERAADLSTLAEELPRSDCNVDRFLPYTWRTEENNPANPEAWFGIWNPDGTPKPSGQAYLNAVELMRGMTSTPAPSSLVPVCSTDYDTAAPPPPPAVTPTSLRLKGPRLILRVRHHRRQRMLIVAGQCHAGCKLHISLLTTRKRKRAVTTRVTTRRTTHFTTRRQIVHLRLSKRLLRRTRSARVRVVAVGRNGGTTTASRRVHLAKLKPKRGR
jgi:hypothetical protein